MDSKELDFVVRTQGDIHRVRARGKAIRDAMDFQSEELAAMNTNLFKPKRKKGKILNIIIPIGEEKYTFKWDISK